MDFIFRRVYRGRIKAVILDWAGTTVDTGCRAPAGVFTQVFRNRGVAITEEQARGPMGLHKRDHIRAISEMEPVAQAWLKAQGRVCVEADVQAMFEEFVPLQLACLRDYSDLTEGTLSAVRSFRKSGLKIGTTTGYNRDMLDILLAESAKRGYVPDSSSCASEVPAGRPAPWMVFENAKALGVYPLEACVKIGDTPSDIDEGLNAGMWTIGLTKVGNEVGLSEDELATLDPAVVTKKIEIAANRLIHSGAHFVAETMAEVPEILGRIEERLTQGEKP